MKTLRQPTKPRKTATFDCSPCGARLQAEAHEGVRTQDGDGVFVIFTCPHCRTETWLGEHAMAWDGK